MRVIHISDCHLFGDENESFRGVNPKENLLRVLEDAVQHIRPTDHLVITGDIAQDESRGTYIALRDMLSTWPTPVHVLPGNHDTPEYLREVFPSSSAVITSGFSLRLGQWLLLGLSTYVKGKVSGQVGDAQMTWLQERLTVHSQIPVALFMHHPPIKVGAPWLDAIGLDDKDAFTAMVRAHTNIQAVFCGHVHQEFKGVIGKTPVYTTPSTAIQFKPKSQLVVMDSLPPGYRIIDLLDVDVDTYVQRIAPL